MNEYILIIQKYLIKVKKYLLVFYNKIKFTFNKQITIKKMYEPMIESRSITNKELLNNLNEITNENKLLIEKSKRLITENHNLKNKILLAQELLTKNRLW